MAMLDHTQMDMESEPTIVTRFADLEPGICNTLARVSYKSDTQSYKGYDDSQRMYSYYTLVDRDGEPMRAVAFDKNHERLFPVVKRNKLYVLRNVWVKEADRQYTSARLQIQLGRDSYLEEQLEANTLNFVQLTQTEPGRLVDLIGVVVEVSGLQLVDTKENTRVSRRQVTIVDRSMHSMKLTMWAHQAENFEGSPKDVIVTRAARIGTYNGKSASASETVFINPDIEEVELMKKWHSRLDEDQVFVPLTKVWSPNNHDDIDL